MNIEMARGLKRVGRDCTDMRIEELRITRE
jgi:hypothetical protein